MRPRDNAEGLSLRLLALRDGVIVLLAGATFETEDKALEAFDSLSPVPNSPLLVEWCNGDGDVLEDVQISEATALEILATTDTRSIAELLTSAAPLGDMEGYREHYRRRRPPAAEVAPTDGLRA